MHAPPKECLYLAIKLLQVFKSYFINLYALHSSVSHNKCNRHHYIDKSIVAHSSLTPGAGKGNMLKVATKDSRVSQRGGKNLSCGLS